jgi:hypothetical protein
MMVALLTWVLLAAPVATVMTAPTARYADLELKFSRGQLSVIAVKLGRFDKPTALRRFRGRFEARVLAGKKIIEQVQFDFPLVGTAESPDISDENRLLAERLRAGVTTTASVRVPLPDGAEALEIYDPNTLKRWPVALKDSPAPDAPAASPRAP